MRLDPSGGTSIPNLDLSIMSAYPPPLPFGAPFITHPQYPPSSSGSHTVMPPFPFQQAQDPNLQRHRQIDMPRAQFANAHSFNNNAQTSRPASTNNGVSSARYVGYGSTSNDIIPTLPFPPISIPLHGNLPQLPSLPPQPVPSTGSTQTPITLTQKQQSPLVVPVYSVEAGSDVATNTLAATSDLEDGELSEGGSSGLTKELAASQQDSIPTAPKIHNDRQQPGRIQVNKVNTVYRSPNSANSRDPLRDRTQTKSFGRSPNHSPSARSPKATNHTVERREYNHGKDMMQSSESKRDNPGIFLEMHRTTKWEGNPSLAFESGSQSANEARNTRASGTNTNSRLNGYPRSDSKTVTEIRVRAKVALQELQPHDIGYTKLIDEGVDSSLLQGLYGEMGVQIPSHELVKQTLHSARPANHSTPSGESFAGKVSSEPGKKRPLEAISDAARITFSEKLDKVVPKTNPISSQQLPSTQQRLEQRKQDRVNIEPLQNSQKSDVSLGNLGTKDDNSKKPHTLKMIKPSGETQRTHTGTVADSASTAPTKIEATQASKSIKPPQSSQSNPVMAKPADKTLERKDYIARMLAAKAGKSIPISNAMPTVTTSVAHGVTTAMQPPAIDLPNASTREQLYAPGSKSVASVRNQGSRETSTEQNASIEAKRKAQTDLARQKMEALKNRNASQQVINHIGTLAPPPHPLPAIPPPSVSDESSIPRTQLHSPLRSTPHASYFSPTSELQPFNIPGLFMASARSSSVISNEQPMSGASHTTNHQNVQATVGFTSADTLGDAQVTLPQPEANHISGGEPSSIFPTETLDSPLRSTSKFNEPRKRPQASDFIDSPPRQAKRRLGQKDDMSVIIDVSEDEVSDDSDAGGDAMDFELDLGYNLISKDLPRHDSRTGKQKTIGDLPPLTDFPTRKKLPDSSALATPPAAQSPGNIKEQEGLRTKVKEIELMKRRIAELELRNKVKQTSSRAQSPGTPANGKSLPKLAEPPSVVNEEPNFEVIIRVPIESAQAQAQAKTHEPALVNAESQNNGVGPEGNLQKRGKESNLITAASAILEAVDKVVSEEKQQGQPLNHHSEAHMLAPVEIIPSQPDQATATPEKQQGQTIENQVQGSAEIQVKTDQLRTTESGNRQDEEPPNAETSVVPLESVGADASHYHDTAAMIADEERRRRRRAEIESGLPVLDASVERTRQKLEELRKQMEYLQNEVQEGIEGRRMLVNELVGLSPAPSPTPKALPRQKPNPIDESVDKPQITDKGKRQGK